MAEVADADDRLPARRRGGDALAQRPARARRRRARPRRSVPAATCDARSCSCRSAPRLRVLLAIVLSRRQLLHDGAQVARADERQLGERALPGLRLHPAGAAHRSAVRARAEHVLRLLRVRHRQDELGPALVLRRADRRDRARRRGALRRVSRLGVPRGSARRGRSAGARRGSAIRSPRACARSPGAAPPRSPGRWRRTPST